MATPRKKVSSKTYKSTRTGASEGPKRSQVRVRERLVKKSNVQERLTKRTNRGAEGPKRSMPRKKK